MARLQLVWSAPGRVVRLEPVRVGLVRRLGVGVGSADAESTGAAPVGAFPVSGCCSHRRPGRRRPGRRHPGHRRPRRPVSGAWLTVLALVTAHRRRVPDAEFQYGQEATSFDLFEAVLAPVMFVLPAAGARWWWSPWPRRSPRCSSAAIPSRRPSTSPSGCSRPPSGSVVFAELRPGTRDPAGPSRPDRRLLVISLVNHIALVGVLWLDQRQPLRQVRRLEPAPGLSSAASWPAVNLAFGVLFVAAYVWVPAATLLFLVPLAVLHWASRAYAQRAGRPGPAGRHAAGHPRPGRAHQPPRRRPRLPGRGAALLRVRGGRAGHRARGLPGGPPQPRATPAASEQRVEEAGQETLAAALMRAGKAVRVSGERRRPRAHPAPARRGLAGLPGRPGAGRGQGHRGAVHLQPHRLRGLRGGRAGRAGRPGRRGGHGHREGRAARGDPGGADQAVGDRRAHLGRDRRPRPGRHRVQLEPGVRGDHRLPVGRHGRLPRPGPAAAPRRGRARGPAGPLGRRRGGAAERGRGAAAQRRGLLAELLLDPGPGGRRPAPPADPDLPRHHQGAGAEAGREGPAGLGGPLPGPGPELLPHGDRARRRRRHHLRQPGLPAHARLPRGRPGRAERVRADPPRRRRRRPGPLRRAPGRPGPGRRVRVPLPGRRRVLAQHRGPGQQPARRPGRRRGGVQLPRRHRAQAGRGPAGRPGPGAGPDRPRRAADGDPGRPGQGDRGRGRRRPLRHPAAGRRLRDADGGRRALAHRRRPARGRRPGRRARGRGQRHRRLPARAGDLGRRRPRPAVARVAPGRAGQGHPGRLVDPDHRRRRRTRCWASSPSTSTSPAGPARASRACSSWPPTWPTSPSSAATPRPSWPTRPPTTPSPACPTGCSSWTGSPSPWPAPSAAAPRWPCCSWTWTGSSSSTTRSATTPATGCWSPWASASRTSSGPATPWPASAATSSPSSARASPTRPTPWPSPSGSPRWPRPRSRSATPRCSSP